MKPILSINSWSLVGAAVGLSFSMPFIAEADNKFVGCREVQDNVSNAPVGHCELRLSDQTQVLQVTAGAGDQKPDAMFIPFKSMDPPTPVAFLLDQGTMTLNRQDFNRLRSSISAILEPDARFISYGVFAYSNDLETIAPIGTAPATIKRALNSVNQTPGRLSELLRSVTSVAEILKKSRGDRKVLIIFSDGRFYDTAYSAAEVSKQLKDGGITTFAVVPGKSVIDLTVAQTLRRITDDTAGELFLGTDAPVIKSMKGYLVSGGFVTFPVLGGETKLRADLGGNNKVEAIFESQLYMPPAADTPTATSASPPVTSAPLDLTPLPAQSSKERLLSLPKDFLDWIRGSRVNQLITVAAAIALFLLACFVGARMIGRRHFLRDMSSDRDSAQSGTIAALDPALARFEFLDGNESTELIHSIVTRIGRQKDNDIVLRNTSVHRHHAVLKQDSTGPFVIFDLGGENRVIVNGNPVNTAKLQDGDLVELGDVRMRFRLLA